MPEANHTALGCNNLTLSYPTGHLWWRRPRLALSDLTLSIPTGTVFGLLGPNGAGKTSTIKLLVGLVRPDSGTMTVLGLPWEDASWRQRTGYLPEHPYLYDYLTLREYLDYVGALFALPRAARRTTALELVERVGLSDVADVPLRRFSKGMLQRAGLAQALVNDPALVILDEPMSGLDPLGRRMVRDLIRDLRSAGKTVLFSTHILPDAEELCDRVALLSRGRLVRTGDLAEILSIRVTSTEVLVSGYPANAPAHPGIEGAHEMGDRCRLNVAEGQLGQVILHVERAGGRVLSVQPVRESLEDFFMREVGGEAVQRPAGAVTWDRA